MKGFIEVSLNQTKVMLQVRHIICIFEIVSNMSSVIKVKGHKHGYEVANSYREICTKIAQAI